jgi:hypothetical protein
MQSFFLCFQLDDIYTANGFMRTDGYAGATVLGCGLLALNDLDPSAIPTARKKRSTGSNSTTTTTVDPSGANGTTAAPGNTTATSTTTPAPAGPPVSCWDQLKFEPQ